MTTLARPPAAPGITLHDLQRAKAASSFEYFLGYVKVLEPPPGGGRIDFVMWSHLKEVVHLLGTERLLSIHKARQLGLTWVLAAWALWVAQYQTGAVVLLLSQGQSEAAVFLGKCRYIWSELPEHLRVPLGTDSTTQMTFPQSNSKLGALPSTENAGRSETATLVIQDEAARHDHLDANYLAVKPTIDAGGQLIQVTTIDKANLGSLSTQIFRTSWYQYADNGFKAAFFPWQARPGRDQEWYDKRKAEAADTLEMSAELYMEQEYPGSVEEMLRPSRVLSAFDPDVLSLMEDDVRKPIQTSGPLSIYQRHAVGKRYAAGTDTSHGAGLDASITAVIDVGTGYVVADANSAVLPPEELAAQSVKLLAMYDNPVWGIEDNDRGILTIRKAQELQYPRIWERAEDKPGWQTNSRTRELLWGELIEAVGQRLVTIPSKVGLGEFSSVIRNPDKDGRIEAMAGAHDDYPMAVGIAWQMRKHAYDGRPRKIKSQKFGRRFREMISIRAY